MVIAMYSPHFYAHEGGGGVSDFQGVYSHRVARFDYPVCRPLDGFYDLRNFNVRNQHGRLARYYGVYGFAFYHYWSGGPIMNEPLEAMLFDGQPDIPFMLCWANHASLDSAKFTPWSNSYTELDWKPHFDWLLRFFKHPNYILRNGRPVLLVYRIHEVSDSERMMSFWNQWALDAGFVRGLFLVQMNGRNWNSTSIRTSPVSNGVMEFYPHFYNVEHGVSIRPMDEMLATRVVDSEVLPENYFFGVHGSYNDKPRHATGNEGYVFPYHPVVLKSALKQQLARSPPGNYIFLNSWNEWGDGGAIEPSVEFGHSWLNAVREAVTESEAGVPPFAVPRAGIPIASHRKQSKNVCFLVRTYDGHGSGLFTLRRMLFTLQSLEHIKWKAFVMDSNMNPFDGLERIIASMADPRIVFADVPQRHRLVYDPVSSAFPAVDAMLFRTCLDPSEDFDAFIVTNGDNFYSPDSLNILPDESDIVLMNFHSYTLANSISLTGASMSQCCTRFNSYTCTAAAPQIGHIDLGAMVIRRASWLAAGLNFSRFTDACPLSCHDGAFAQHVHHILQWRIEYHPLGSCAFLHNPNPLACRLVGGLYYDSADWRKAGCFDAAAFPIPLGQVDWTKFLEPGGCVCERGQ